MWGVGCSLRPRACMGARTAPCAFLSVPGSNAAYGGSVTNRESHSGEWWLADGNGTAGTGLKSNSWCVGGPCGVKGARSCVTARTVTTYGCYRVSLVFGARLRCSCFFSWHHASAPSGSGSAAFNEIGALFAQVESQQEPERLAERIEQRVDQGAGAQGREVSHRLKALCCQQ